MMKSWQLLVQKLERWRHNHLHHSSFLGIKKPLQQQSTNLSQNPQLNQRPQKESKVKFRSFLVIFFLSVIALTSIVGYRFYNQSQLIVGKISTLTILAPYSAEFNDTKTILERRREVQTGIIPMLRQNEAGTTEIQRQLKQ